MIYGEEKLPVSSEYFAMNRKNFKKYSLSLKKQKQSSSGERESLPSYEAFNALYNKVHHFYLHGCVWLWPSR